MIEEPTPTQPQNDKVPSAIRTRHSLRLAKIVASEAHLASVTPRSLLDSQIKPLPEEEKQPETTKIDSSTNVTQQDPQPNKRVLRRAARTANDINKQSVEQISPSENTNDDLLKIPPKKRSKPTQECDPDILDLDKDITLLKRAGKNVDEYFDIHGVGTQSNGKRRYKKRSPKVKPSESSEAKPETEPKRSNEDNSTTDESKTVDKSSLTKKIRKDGKRKAQFQDQDTKLKLEATKGGKFRISMLLPKKTSTMNSESALNGSQAFILENLEGELNSKKTESKGWMISEINSDKDLKQTKVKLPLRKNDIMEEEEHSLTDSSSQAAKNDEPANVFMTVKEGDNFTVEIGEEFQAEITPLNLTKKSAKRIFKTCWTPGSVSEELIEDCDRFALAQLGLSSTSRQKLLGVLAEHNYNKEEFCKMIEIKNHWMRSKLRMKKVWSGPV